MRTRRMKHDPVALTQTLWHEHADGSVTVERQQDIEGILEHNLAIRNQTKKSDRWGPGKYVAEIPNVVLMQLRKDGILDDDKRFREWLQRSENMPFRTANYGRLI